MEDDRIYRSARSLGYRLSQTEKGQRKLRQLEEINRNRLLIMDGIQEGIDLANWEKNKTKNMNDEKTDPNYTKGFNLAYWLNKSDDGEKHYQELMEMQKSAKFRDTTMYQGLVAGREEAFKERGKNITHPILTGEQVAEVKKQQALDAEREAFKAKFLAKGKDGKDNGRG